MTHEQWNALTPQEQRIKVAELCGWKHNGSGFWHRKNEVRALTYTEGRWEDIEPLPDYLNDLNEMHEVEKTLSGSNRFHYEILLHQLNTFYGLGISVWETVHATASQRAEAFVSISNVK